MPKKDPKLLKKIRLMPCLACGQQAPSEAAHITTKRLVGDVPKYVMPLCIKHHREQHIIGIRTFVLKYKLPINLDAIYPHLTFEWDL